VGAKRAPPYAAAERIAAITKTLNAMPPSPGSGVALG